ncbi:hypothetical protein [Desulfoluna spongiiphila]|uniref:Polysaccharide deacetylase n=1 Tax=Desulfoluna spongiiphila TaxID=419481 RepID=A0A1G5ICH1_9BACT|nr:hypothetical protein [Desulfoluna spongiiphila]SCY73684.1 hypothetical protein SAMN05216233_11911 [Desulfoluna spongiiphila]
MLNIILTIDYEIFGDGSGDVKKHVVKPTEHILNICNKYSVPLTIMFEVNEYQKFVEYDLELNKKLGYSPAQEMKKQVLDAYSIGHDVQLHIHPQWVDAVYKDGKWAMIDSELSITEFSRSKIHSVIQQGKTTLENLIYEVDKEYTVSAMRLTNLPWVEAPMEVHSAMIKTGIFVHSLAVSDFSSSLGYWQLAPDNLIYEIPIHSVPDYGYKRLSWHRIKTALYRKFNKSNSVSKHDISISRNYIKMFLQLKYLLFQPYSFKWDFCKQSWKKMLIFLDEAEKKYNYAKNEIPLVMISHSKDFFNESNFEKFLSKVNTEYCRKGKIKFTTFNDFNKLI